MIPPRVCTTFGRDGRRRLPAITAAATGLLVVLAASGWSSPDTVVRLHAEDAVTAAVVASRSAFPGSAPEVLLAQDAAYADVLAAAVPHARAGLPLLLTPRNRVAPAVLDELARLQAGTVHVLGGPAAVSQEVAAELADHGYVVRRLAGPSRVDTAIVLARRFLPQADTALLVRGWPDAQGDAGQAVADALAAGALGSANGAPVLLTAGDRLSDPTAAYLESAGIRAVRIVGGRAAVGPQVEAELADRSIAVERIAGSNRFATAVAVARALGAASGAEAGTVGIAAGTGDAVHASALPATAWFRAAQAPVVLVAGDQVPDETAAFLDGAAQVRCAGLVSYRACDAAARAGGLREPHLLEPSEPFERAWLTVADDQDRRHAVDAYVAADPQTRQRGLMYRESLPEDAGMVFRFPADTSSGFWMKNTRIPLSIAFAAADGAILRILDMDPCTEDPCPVYRPGVSYRSALEMNQGWFDRHGIAPGGRVILPADLPPAR